MHYSDVLFSYRLSPRLTLSMLFGCLILFKVCFRILELIIGASSLTLLPIIKIQSVSSKNLDGKKIKFYSSLNTDFRELVNISNFYEANKVNLFFKKIPKIFHYKLRKLIISFLPNSIYLFIRRIYRKFFITKSYERKK